MDDPLAAWKQALAGRARNKRASRQKRTPPPAKAGMVRRAAPRDSDGKEGQR